MLDIREDKKKVGAFLNPVRKDVRKFALSIVAKSNSMEGYIKR